ncbi:MAG: asparagine synthase (glutamine-hydrolyzing) [Acidobacteria bacterium]|nr:asparagine synthase (glutamine-hydrolyzing) [Acidobacteriota bacterium]
MCGICGIVNFDKEERIDAELLERMTNTLAHRGPDDAGYFLDGNVGLGHRRLSIIDLSGGKQPIFNEDGSAVIVFNGEIYNYADLTPPLVSQGHTFRTRCDTEVILHSYEQYGSQCVQQLRGMFAFAIWDRHNEQLFLARDRLGVKPIYFYQGAGFFAFASEIKALLELPSARCALDPEAFDLYLSLRYVPGPRTMFQGIYKLQPGHFLLFNRSGVRIQRYWDVPYDPHPRPRAWSDTVEEFEQLLEESVRLRLMAEVPLGVFLSGGLDSSTILAVMSKITQGERIKTFSVGYGGGAAEEKSNEFYYANLAATAFRAEHHEFRVNAQDFADFIPELVWHLDEPLADPSCIPLYFISKLARNYITVVLSGEGADELLGGYYIYRKMLALERIYRSFAPLPALLAPRLAHLMPGEARRSYLKMAGLPLESRYKGVSRGFRPELKGRLLSDGKARDPEEKLREHFLPYFRQVEGRSPLDRMLYADTKIWLPDDILLKADKMTMANALELRVPFLDHKLVEFCAGLPTKFKLHGFQDKFLLRQAMGKVLPKPILERPKKGFPVPTGEWLRIPMREFAHDVLLSPNSACRTYLNSSVLEGMVLEHENGRVNREQEIWTLLIFEFWHRLFLENKHRPAGREMHTVAKEVIECV